MTFNAASLFSAGFEVAAGLTTFQDVSTFSSGLSGSLTRLPDGTSFIKQVGSISIVTQSNGSLEISSPNFVFNEYLGQGDNLNTSFPLAKTPTSPKNISVFVNGLLQMPATTLSGAPFQDYSVTGSNIFFTTSSTPEQGSIIMTNYTTNESN